MNRALVLPALLLILPLLAPVARAGVPPVIVPPHSDSVGTDSPQAPLMIPGRANPADSLRKTPERVGREQFLLGQAMERQHQPAAAIAAYRNAVHAVPDMPVAHYRMGVLFTAVAQHRAAAREYSAELNHHPEDRDAARALALEEAQLGDTATAVTRLETLVQSQPDDEPSWQALGFAYGTANRPAQAESALRHALELAPGDADAWRDLGALYSAQRRDREARDAYAKASRFAPHDPNVWVNLGNLERRMDRPAAALDAYREALRRDSSSALAWRGRIAVYEATRRPLDAARTFRDWLAREPDDVTLRVETIQSFEQAGRMDLALELAREGVALAPRSGQARLALGLAQRAAGQERAGLTELRRAQALMKQPDAQAQVGSIIAGLRARAPDSLRAMYAADSVARERPAPADSGRARPAH